MQIAMPFPNGPRVAKFGGTSVATADQLLKVKAIIDADKTRRIVVPSAPGKAHKGDTKITDLLYLSHELATRQQPIDQVWSQIEKRYLDITKDLHLSLDLRPVLAETRKNIEAGASADYVASRGEAIHGRIVAALLDARYVDAADVIRFKRRNVLDEEQTYALTAKACAGSGLIVIPGFYGSGPSGEILTFTRGGSDVTGAVVARAVEASVYENWTDVSGVLMADPGVVPDAMVITEITYRELRELAYMGAKVLHEEAVIPVRQKGIPINLRNTNRPLDPGTSIVGDREGSDRPVVGIAGTAGFTVITLFKVLMNREIGFGRRVLDVIEHHGVSYEHTPSGIDTMSVVISDASLGDKLEEILSEIRAAVNPDEITVSRDMALIATVGKGMNRHVGVAAKLFAALAQANVNIRMIDQGSTEQNIIVGVESKDLKTAITTIYRTFA